MITHRVDDLHLNPTRIDERPVQVVTSLQRLVLRLVSNECESARRAIFLGGETGVCDGPDIGFVEMVPELLFCEVMGQVFDDETRPILAQMAWPSVSGCEWTLVAHIVQWKN